MFGSIKRRISLDCITRLLCPMNRHLENYAERLFGQASGPVEVFAKILAPNDDSGRHGVVVPVESYDFFPNLPIEDPDVNQTVLFQALNAKTGQPTEVAWKYYQRYPERRLTRLDTAVNQRDRGRRLLVVFRTTDAHGGWRFAVDAMIEGVHPDFSATFFALFGDSRREASSGFVQRPVGVKASQTDAALTDLLTRFDEICAMGFVTSKRVGDTGLGYTFEELMGIEENNDQGADFRGIEIKCKLRREKTSGGKINLFQLGPRWKLGHTNIERLRLIGQKGVDGLHSCYSQVTTTPNNRGLNLAPKPTRDVDLLWNGSHAGTWLGLDLARRLKQKHSRAVFVKADRRRFGDVVKYHYNELVYCEHPDIDRFIAMIKSKSIVFEFTMSERAGGVVRNHGYPWRLCDEKLLDELFAIRLGLRSTKTAS